MPTLHVSAQIYMNKKNKQNLLKLHIFLFFSEASPMKLCQNLFFWKEEKYL